MPMGSSATGIDALLERIAKASGFLCHAKTYRLSEGENLCDAPVRRAAVALPLENR
jgi:hypothetical protein